MVKWDPAEFVARSIDPVTIDGTIRMAKIVERAKRYRASLPCPIDLGFVAWPHPRTGIQASHLEIEARIVVGDEEKEGSVSYSNRFPIDEMDEPARLHDAILSVCANALVHSLGWNLVGEDGTSRYMRERPKLVARAAGGGA